MRLAALVDSTDHVCCRYRLRAFEPFFRKAGHDLTYLPDPRTITGRIRLIRRLGRFDAVILQRRLPPAWETWLLRRHAKRLIFDVDDAVWLRDSYSGKGFESRKRSGRFRYLMRRVDVVAAGNDYLAEAAALANAPGQCVIPTCVDVANYPTATHDAPTAKLVWIGSSSTLKGIEAVRPIWEEIGRTVAGVEMKIICDRFPKFDCMPVVEVPWREASERAELAASDIGVSWIPDDPWSRGKCGLKLLQSMAAGLPVVANRVGVHPEMIMVGETGYLADTPDDWTYAVRMLVANPRLRQEKGLNARNFVRRNFSVEVGAAAWLKLLDSLT